MEISRGRFLRELSLSDYLSVGVISKVFPLQSVQAALLECDSPNHHQRDLSLEAVVYYVIALGLFRPESGNQILRRLEEGLRLDEVGAPLRIVCSSNLSRARAALGTKPFSALRARIVRPLADKLNQGAWYDGKRLVSIDGVTFRVADEERNRREFSPPETKDGEPSIPGLRVTLLVEVGTQAPLAWEYGPIAESDLEQAPRLDSHLPRDSLLLADEHYVSAGLLKAVRETRAETLCGAGDDLEFPPGVTLDDGSFLSEFKGMPVRVVAYRLRGSGEPVRQVFTTLLDSARWPAIELAELYHARQSTGSARDEIKARTLLHRSKLRSRTPGLVKQEIEGLMLAYYAVRRFLHEVAPAIDAEPDQLSIIPPVQIEGPESSRDSEGGPAEA